MDNVTVSMPLKAFEELNNKESDQFQKGWEAAQERVVNIMGGRAYDVRKPDNITNEQWEAFLRHIQKPLCEAGRRSFQLETDNQTLHPLLRLRQPRPRFH